MRARVRRLPGVGFIGAGRVGSALAWHCHRLKYPIAGVVDRKPKQAWVCYGLLKLPHEKLKPSEVAERSDVLFLTVPDRHVGPEFVAVRRWLRPGTIVVHCSGVYGIEVFKGAEEHGIETLALHPMQSFSSHAQAIQSLPGSHFALEGTARGLRFGRKFCRQLEGGYTVVSGEDRPLYHAMCVFAANFQNALLDSAETLAARLGVSPRKAGKMLAPMMRTVTDNLVEYGAVPSMTGPVQRGDVDTVCQHIDVLKKRAPELVPLYRELTMRLVGMARRQGLARDKVKRLKDTLDRECR